MFSQTAKEIKSENKQMRPKQTYKLWHSKKKKKSTKWKDNPWNGEKVFANDLTDKELISKIYK